MEQSKNKQGLNPEPAKSNERLETDQKENKPSEGDYRNVQTGSGKASDFDDEYEIQQEDEITMEEVRTEKDNRNGKN